MSYEVYLHEKAKEKLTSLDKELKARIRKSLKKLKEDPKKRGKSLKGSKFYRLRIGDYRAIYEVDKAKRKAVVLFIGHRKNVYDDFSKLL